MAFRVLASIRAKKSTKYLFCLMMTRKNKQEILVQVEEFFNSLAYTSSSKQREERSILFNIILSSLLTTTTQFSIQGMLREGGNELFFSFSFNLMSQFISSSNKKKRGRIRRRKKFFANFSCCFLFYYEHEIIWSAASIDNKFSKNLNSFLSHF